MPCTTSLLLVFLGFVSYVFAQNSTYCQTYDRSLPNSLYCIPFVSDQVFINNTHQIALDQILANDPNFQLLRKIQSILPVACYKSTMSLICKSYFPSCSLSDPSSPSYPCLTTCESALQSCGSIWSVVDVEPPINCSTNIVGESWRDEDCSSTVLSSSGPLKFPAVTSCPSVYGMRKDPLDSEAPCSIRCPDPSYTRDEFKHVANITLGFTIGGTLLMIFLILSFLIDYKKRQFPAKLQPYLFFCMLCLSVGTMLSGTNPMDTTMCADPTTYSTQDNNSLCATQAFLIMFFSFTALSWICVLSCVNFLCIFLEIRPMKIAPYERYIHAAVWGIAWIFAIALCATHSFNFGYSTRIYCFIIIDLTRHPTIDYPLFYYPMMGILVVTTVFFALCLYKLIVLGCTNREERTTVNKVVIQAQRRIMLVIAVLIILFAIVFGNRFSVPNSETIGQINDRDTWANCKVKAELFHHPYPPACDTDINPKRRAYSSMAFQNVVLSIVSYFVFLGFGTDPRIYHHWKTLARCVLDRDFTRLKGHVIHGYSSSSGLSPTHPSHSGSGNHSTTHSGLSFTLAPSPSQTDLGEVSREMATP